MNIAVISDSHDNIINLKKAVLIANSNEFDYIFYGHLHEIDHRIINNTIVLNPGELGGWLTDASFYIFNPETREFKKILIK